MPTAGSEDGAEFGQLYGQQTNSRRPLHNDQQCAEKPQLYNKIQSGSTSTIPWSPWACRTRPHPLPVWAQHSCRDTDSMDLVAGSTQRNSRYSPLPPTRMVIHRRQWLSNGEAHAPIAGTSRYLATGTTALSPQLQPPQPSTPSPPKKAHSGSPPRMPCQRLEPPTGQPPGCAAPEHLPPAYHPASALPPVRAGNLLKQRTRNPRAIPCPHWDGGAVRWQRCAPLRYRSQPPVLWCSQLPAGRAPCPDCCWSGFSQPSGQRSKPPLEPRRCCPAWSEPPLSRSAHSNRTAPYALG
mmetsp:Transcript_22912/g.50331  ORF Transcript_22912/g.50331 Transcript_22912/m.50331 type:complete len:295 (+) Transcript_22912:1293-2177(+)